GPYALFLNASTLLVGVIATLPPLIGAMFQGLAVWTTEKFRARRRIIVIAAYLHCAAILAMAVVPALLPTGLPAALAVLGIATLYFLLAGFIAPPWNSLMGDLVPARWRGRFFGLRTKYIAIYAFSAVVIAGVVLDVFHKAGIELW